ncbi:YfiR family protein [Lacimicrobium sp. SS2-24]|uniref:YfiR family protein n=1 Tax=Lacimicrobium sp. SS2-24 TaxID=2005569 RepID=UPI000B4B2104|nr:YfiR family protein [Lacimicrobium sp. SS2-24]
MPPLYSIFKRIVWGLALMGAFSASAIGFTSEQLRAPFLLYIVGYTQFSEAAVQTGPLRFCFFEGEDFPHAQIFRQATGKKVNGRDISLYTLSDISDIPKVDDEQPCHLLFIGEEQESDEVYALLEQLNQHTISVGESPGFIEHGGMMAIYPLPSKMKIFFNREAYQNTQLKFSSALLKRVNFR